LLTDSHCHLDRLNLDRHDGKLSTALQHARDAGVSRFLCIGIDFNNASQIIEITGNYDDVYASVGLHPLELNDAVGNGVGEQYLERLPDWLEEMGGKPGVIGIGETGLDYYYSEDAIEVQKQAFVIHLQAASEQKKPVIVHTRDAGKDTISLLGDHASNDSAGILHCFTETEEVAMAALEMNFMISFSGIITFKNADNLREIARKLPIESILVETDSPYLAPVPWRGKPNEPAYVVEVAKCLADIRGMAYEDVCRIGGENFSRLFGLQDNA
jgi:TatD DNase family protein